VVQHLPPSYVSFLSTTGVVSGQIEPDVPGVYPSKYVIFNVGSGAHLPGTSLVKDSSFQHTISLHPPGASLSDDTEYDMLAFTSTNDFDLETNTVSSVLYPLRPGYSYEFTHLEQIKWGNDPNNLTTAAYFAPFYFRVVYRESREPFISDAEVLIGRKKVLMVGIVSDTLTYPFRWIQAQEVFDTEANTGKAVLFAYLRPGDTLPLLPAVVSVVIQIRIRQLSDSGNDVVHRLLTRRVNITITGLYEG
jgi:hypothetical protein